MISSMQQVAMENRDAGVRLEAVSLIPSLGAVPNDPVLALNDLTKSVE